MGSFVVNCLIRNLIEGRCELLFLVSLMYIYVCTATFPHTHIGTGMSFSLHIHPHTWALTLSFSLHGSLKRHVTRMTSSSHFIPHSAHLLPASNQWYPWVKGADTWWLHFLLKCVSKNHKCSELKNNFTGTFDMCKLREKGPKPKLVYRLYLLIKIIHNHGCMQMCIKKVPDMEG